jgi:leucyl aminopeptidase
MSDRSLPLVAGETAARPLYAVRPAGLPALLARLADTQAAWLRGNGFTAAAQELQLLPGEGGVAGAVLGLGDDHTPFAFGDLANRLPAEGAWRIEPGDFKDEDATLGFLLGAYRYEELKARSRPAATLAVSGQRRAIVEAEAIWMARDLINRPSNLLGPSELADAIVGLGRRYGAAPIRFEGTDLATAYPAIATVGYGSARPPVMAGFSWRGSKASDDSPLLALCGKGVCFDSGGLDVKPAESMVRMKKDMGGAAVLLGIARVLMEADAPIRLVLRVGCVENSVSGRAMRPLDVLRSRRGLTVEIGNTDAEGRLVLCDLLAEASDQHPDLLLDCATLTGAARTALGPDLPALFSTDDAWAKRLLAMGEARADAMWRLPLWHGYDSWLDSPVAEVSSTGSGRMAGAVVAALFLRRFITSKSPWVHFDVYAWNDTARPGRPEGGEAPLIRSVSAAIEANMVLMQGDRNMPVT